MGGRERERGGRRDGQGRRNRVSEQAGKLSGRVSSLPVTTVTSYACSICESGRRQSGHADSQAHDLPGNTHQNKASLDKAVPETGAPVGPEEQVTRLHICD